MRASSFLRPTGLAVGLAQERSRSGQGLAGPVRPVLHGSPVRSRTSRVRFGDSPGGLARAEAECQLALGDRGRALVESTPRGRLPTRRHRPIVPRARGPGARALARARRLPRVDPPPRGLAAIHLLRGPAHRERAPGLPPRPGARVQGRLPALPDDARPLRAPQGWLGLPRPAGGARGGEGARVQLEGRHRALRGGGVQREVPRVRAPLHRRVERPHGADRLLDRHRRGVLHALERVRGVGLVVAEAGVGEGPPVGGPQGGSVLHALRHGAQLARAGRRATGT